MRSSAAILMAKDRLITAADLGLTGRRGAGADV